MTWTSVGSLKGPTGAAATVTPYTVKVVSTSTYTLLSGDLGKVLEFTVACTVTVPTGLSQGFNCSIVQTGTGQVTVAAGSGITLKASGSLVKTSAQEAVCGLYMTTTTVARFFGDRA